jgi:RHS repeat-associated protein
VVFVQMDQQTIADYPVGGAATTPTFRYVYASYIDEPVVRKGPTSTSTVHFYHRNQQYSITAITTSTGAIAERYAYTAYGQPTILNTSGTPLSPQTSTLNSRYSYTGREWDSTLGLHHFRARWMSPSAGRFLGRDPIGYEDGWNFYRLYISLHKRDPSGNGCNLCFKPGRLKKVIYEPDDPDEIAACIYEFVADPQNPRHGIMTGAHMTECQRQDGCKNVGNCSDLNLDLDEMRIQRAVAPIGGALPFTRPHGRMKLLMQTRICQSRW